MSESIDSERVISQESAVPSEKVEDAKDSVDENATTKIAMITVDDKPSGDVDESMKIVDCFVTEDAKSTIDASEKNENLQESNKELVSQKNESPSNLTQNAESNCVEMQNSSQQNSSKSNKNTDETIRTDGDKKTEATEKTEPLTSLSVIALAYENSDSESEQIECVFEKNPSNFSSEMEVQITKEYRNVQAVSEDESESDSSSSSDDSIDSSDVESVESDDSENESEKNVTKKKNERNNRQTASKEYESKSEFDDLPPIEELKISVPEVLCDPLGEVAWMVEQMVVVRPKPGKPTLNLDTVLFVERGRRVLGRIFDVFGQVSDPHYCVRFNSTEHIKESDIKVGMTAYFCPNTEYTSVVFVQDLLKMKPTDELADDEHPEFSDDEEERAYYASLKQKQRSEKAKTGEEIPQKRQRTDPGWKSNHPWSSGRRQEQSRKPEKNVNESGRSVGGQRNARGSCNPGNSWQQYPPPAYSNTAWPPHGESYCGNGWRPSCPSQNPFGYAERFENLNAPGNSPAFFRPPHSFPSGPVPYMQNGPYSPQSNPRGYPGVNFGWQHSAPRQHSPSWRFPPPPPPPPPGI